MDPNLTLRALRALAAKVLYDWENGNRVDRDAVRALAERFEYLDEWISRGGFLPEPWTKRVWS
jgi:hypothetical protein